ncbi:MAG: lytic transglycosylase domain-containing protein [Acidisphaera sp.]|nr:lytic transglycosylase domain-containing protein [Acidisphaera sp.]
MLAPLTAACIAGAAALFNVAEPALWTILRAEGGQVGACTLQANGTHDCGPAQVNAETWVPRLARLMRRPSGDVYAELRDNGCFNVFAAAYVLHSKLGEADGDGWDAAGRYNSATPALKQRYQSRLIEAWTLLFRAERRGG